MNLKSTFGLLSVIAGAMGVQAQPTLTAATSTPVVGLSGVYNQNTTFLAGPEGTNQNWDFSGQSFPTVSNVTFEACNSSNNCASFPGTTVVAHQGSNFIYYGGTAGALAINGVSNGSLNIPNSDPQDFFHFPLTYGNTYTDTWGSTLVNGGVTFYRSGIDTVVADAWGTLKTPAGTFNNTLRVKRISTYQDSANVGGMAILIYYKSTLYSWNDINHKDVLYSTFSLVANNQGNESTTNGSTYTSGQTDPPPPTGIATAIANPLNIHVAPNPAHDFAQVSLTLTERSNVDIRIVDVTGRSVYQAAHNNIAAGNQKIALNIADIPAGIYMVNIHAGNTAVTSKLMIR